MNIRKFAAIDIGSNGVRLLVSNIIEEKGQPAQFRKSSLVRVPIRLGADAFATGKISENNTSRIINAMKAYTLLMQVHGVEKFKACATSAMREADNGVAIVDQIKKQTGIEIDIIDGETEAKIISETDLNELVLGNKAYLYVDVGGGSTELTFFSKGKIVTSKSFKLGTVRHLEKDKKKTVRAEMKNWIKTQAASLSKIALIGSGGNINKIFKMSNTPIGRPLSYVYLRANHKFLKQLTYEQRISELGLNPDRADVIIPAGKIFLDAMKWSRADKVYVPKIGLADGVVKALYYEKIR